MTIKYKDDAVTVLSSNLSAVALSCVVSSSASFPTLSAATDYFYATIIRSSDNAKETIKVTAIAGTTWTIERAQGSGESALAFLAADSVELRWGENVTEDLIDSNIKFAKNYSTLALAVAAAAGKELVISTTITVSADITISNVTLRFVLGGKLSVNTTKTVTNHGEVIAGNYNIFTGAGTVVGKFGGSELNVLWFLDTSDFGLAFTKTIAVIRSQSQYTTTIDDPTSRKIIYPAGRWVATTSINGTDLIGRALVIECQGFRNINFPSIRADHNGVVADFTGSPNIEFHGFGIQGGDHQTTPSAGSIPTVGILFARSLSVASGDCGYIRMHGCTVSGHFSIAAVYSYAAEICEYYSTYLENRVVHKPTLTITETNISNVTSSFTTIDTASISNTVVHYYGGQIFSVGGGTADNVYLETASNITFRDTFLFNNNGNSLFYITGGNNIVLDGIREEASGASAQAAQSVYVSNSTVDGLAITNFQSSSDETTGYLLNAATGSTINKLTVHGIFQAYANEGINVDTIVNPEINFAGKITIGTKARNGRVTGNNIVITPTSGGVETCEIYDTLTGSYVNFLQGVTGSVLDTASTNIPGSPVDFPANTVYVYTVRSNVNSNHYSSGLLTSNAAGGGSNALVAFAQSEASVAVVGGTDLFTITNNTGGAATFTFSVSALTSAAF